MYNEKPKTQHQWENQLKIVPWKQIWLCGIKFPPWYVHCDCHSVSIFCNTGRRHVIHIYMLENLLKNLPLLDNKQSSRHFIEYINSRLETIPQVIIECTNSQLSWWWFEVVQPPPNLYYPIIAQPTTMAKRFNECHLLRLL